MYLSQGGGGPPEWFRTVTSRGDSKGIWADFKEDFTAAGENISAIYIPHSTWTTGRNALYLAAERWFLDHGPEGYFGSTLEDRD